MGIAKMGFAAKCHHPSGNYEAEAFGVGQFVSVDNAYAGEDAGGHDGADELAAGDAVLNAKTEYFGGAMVADVLPCLFPWGGGWIQRRSNGGATHVVTRLEIINKY